MIQEFFDVVVIGGGHAGCEAFAAACRIGAQTLLVTPALTELGCQPCNPAVGGPGKSHLVREVVALGGVMGRVTDASGIQFRTLNARKGPAVRATRVQTDSAVYSARMVEVLQSIDNGVIWEDRAIELKVTGGTSDRRVCGIYLEKRGFVGAKTVVVATGTFLRGQLFVGDQTSAGGRAGAPSAMRLASSLEALGVPLLRLKTGTCPRLDGSTVDHTGLEAQPGEVPPPFFDPNTTAVSLPQRSCYLTFTTEATHEVVRQNLKRSALYGGLITGVGPRYCPSFETKVTLFPDKRQHQLFLEPEDQHGRTVYPSGLSTSLPAEVQDALVHTIPGLENARIVRYGYAVEYDAVQPRGMAPTLEVPGLAGLFLAGQILGTSGYEEAAALGLVAGANAALSTAGAPPLVFQRSEAYLGVMIDDLTTQGVDEPYRMFTSRAEYRLLLREDNADERLLPHAERAGLLDAARAVAVRHKSAAIAAARQRLEQTQLNPSAELAAKLVALGLPALAKPTPLASFLQRPDVRLEDLAPLAEWIDALEPVVRERLEIDVRYKGYLPRQQAEAIKLAQTERVRMPKDVDYRALPGLRSELVEKLEAVRPSTLGQASRIPGMTPAAMQLLHLHCERCRRLSGAAAVQDGGARE